MGASCTSGKSSHVQDTVNKITLNKDAIEHLKQLNNDGLSKDQIQKLVKKGQEGKDQDIQDLDQELKNLTQEGKNQMLWEAIEKNDIRLVEAILNKYQNQSQDDQYSALQDSDLYDSQGQSMIHKASSMGHVEILMLLLERTGAKPDLVNSQLATPLHLACKNNRDNVAKFLIGCGVDVNVQDEHGQTPLLICCIHGHLELAQLIVEASASGHTPEQLEVDMRDHRGLTPLNCAAIKGDLKLCRLLIERGVANIEEASPKGCTPLLYGARGGYSQVVQYLLEKGASPLKQDTSGGTVLHHAIEKGHQEVLQVLIEYGVDVYSAIEIADNAGRTPIFEAIDNNVSADMVRLLVNKRNKGGFGAQVNIINYNGQTPLYSAVREGNEEIVKVLVEEAGAKVDLANSEIMKEDANGGLDQEEELYDSEEEKYFMEAYKNAMTPLHIACILGHDQILHYLIEQGANPNKQSKVKGYACLHLAVLANKPEIIIELLTKSQANPHMPDYSGRTLQDMVENFIPSYLDSFNQLLDNLQVERIKRAETDNNLIVATHYYNPDDDRQIQGVHEQDQIQNLYQNQQEEESPDSKLNKDINNTIDNNNEDDQIKGVKNNPQKKFMEMGDLDIEVEEGRPFETIVENVFGRKIALGLIASNWKMKEVSMKIVYKQTEKFLAKDNTHDLQINLVDFVKACTICVDLTCKEKVIKVFTLSLQLMALLITSKKIEGDGSVLECFKNTTIERNIVMKLLQKSEESNTRMTNKIHETLLDFSYHPKIGEAHCSSFILQRIQSHNKAASKSSSSTQNNEQQKQNSNDQTLGSFKGLLAQLALLYKFVNSFGVSIKKRGPLNVADIINSILNSLQHQNQDVRNAATKILLDVQRLTGAVKEAFLSSINEKTKATIMEKLSQVEIENQPIQKNQQEDNDDQLYQLSLDESQSKEILSNLNSGNTKTKEELVKEAQEQIIQKGQSKDWTEREIALKHMKDTFEQQQSILKKTLLQDDQFLTNCTILLKSCLEENNISIYLQAVDVAELFFPKTINTEVVMGSLQTLIRAIVMKTTDTNTRVRKKSVEVINMLWNMQSINNSGNSKQEEQNDKKDNISILIADVLCDSTLQEKSIIGRLGLFIKKASSVETSEELSTKPHQIILGKNYEQLVEFACQWCTHKNTKVRQNALKLIIELCRLNSLDPRGSPFKQRLINYILGLRPSLRDPLVKKINEVCINDEQQQQYIDVNELELNLATKTRSASMDINKKKAQAKNSNLPDISNGEQNSSLLPQMNIKQQTSGSGNNGAGGGGGGGHHPVIVLPHSEPLTEEEKVKSAILIDVFNLEIVTCFFSQTWSTRLASIEKVGEQLYNLDPNRRDAMSAEINRKNLPVEDNFKTFLHFIEEGAKDPVLKNYIAILELFQKALPVFFRYIQPTIIKKDLFPLVSQIIKKTADLKAKIRESSINFCLYLSHQSPIGPEAMVIQVLSELELIQNQQQQQNANAAISLGNSHMIASCIKLLHQFQSQTKLLDKARTNQDLFKRFIDVINASLKHQNPQVRKEAEQLFKLLYTEFGEKLDSLLVGQKSQVQQKLVNEAKQECGITNQQQIQEFNLQKAQTQIRSDLINQSALTNLLKGAQDSLQQLKLPNPKKRLQAIIDIKKAIQKELVNINQKLARELFEPLTLLLRQLLQDESPDIYLESLNVLKFVVGSLAPHLTSLDLHLMMGQFIGIIVNNTISTNMRIQMSSDKVIIFFAKHTNIGPFVVAKDVLKNIEKIIKSLQTVQKKEDVSQVLQEKKLVLLRFLSILQLLLQHFSIILCYQADFYDKCIESIADVMIFATDDQTIKNICIQIIVSLAQIDNKLLEVSVSKLDMNRKTPLRKTMIELEHQQRQGKNVITQDHHAFVSSINPGGGKDSNGQNMKDTRGSFGVSSQGTSLFSPGSTLYGQSPGFGSSQYEWSKKSIDAINKQAAQQQQYQLPQQLSDKRGMRRMISLDPAEQSRYQGNGGSNSSQVGNYYPIVGQSMQSKQFNEQKQQQEGLILPDILPMQNQTSYNVRFGAGLGTIPSQSPLNTIGGGQQQQTFGGAKMSLTSTGGAGFNSGSMTNQINSTSGNNGGLSSRALRTINATPSTVTEQSGIGTGGIINRPPLYIPTKRNNDMTGGRSSGQALTSQDQQQQQQQQQQITKTPISNQQPLGQKSTFDQFKQDFNNRPPQNYSNLYSQIGTAGGSGGGMQPNQMPSLQKKNTISNNNNTNSIFNQQVQSEVKFESGVQRYKEATPKGKSILDEI